LSCFINNINRIDYFNDYLFFKSTNKCIYQHGKSIGIDFNQIFAILSNPTAIAADNAGNVYVLDHEDETIQKFTTNGTFVKEWNIQRTKASDIVPTAIAVDNAGNVYVIDAVNDRVQKFTTNGTFVKEWNIN